ncbi:MAG TPA: hypothetical protein DDY31_16565 [Lachnospiraceae bacterium]|nr:hypothetical protein [Lachnospiraceae bacterium]
MKISHFYSPKFTTLLLYFVFAKIDWSHSIFYFILPLFSSLSLNNSEEKKKIPPAAILSSPAAIPQPPYFRHFPKKRKKKRKKKEEDTAAYLLPSVSSSSLFLSCIFSKEKATKAPYSHALRRIGKKKEGKRAAVVRHPLPFCFFSLPLLQRNARNPVFTRVERGGRKKEEEDSTCYRNFCDGSRTMRFFCLRMTKNGSF